MDLKILLPYQIFLDIKNIKSLVAETSEGSFGLLPNRLDCVAAIVPSILSYQTESNKINYLAIDEGILVKAGAQVVLSVLNAFAGNNLNELRKSVEEEYKNLDKDEKNIRSTMAKMESGFLYSLEKFKKA